MAVIDIYANADLQSQKLATAANLTGNKVVVAAVTFEIGAADSNTSVYRVFPDLNPNLIPVDIKVMNDAMGGAASSYDLGIYAGGKGAVINKTLFSAATSFQAARIKSAPLDGMGALDIANLGKKLHELAGHTVATKKESYDVCLTANTVTAAAGTVTVVGTFIQG